MRHELWRAILFARGEIDKLVDSAVGSYPDHGPPRVMTGRPPPRAPGGPQLVAASGGGGIAAAAAYVPRATTAEDTARTWTDPARQAQAPVAEHDPLHRLHHEVQERIERLKAALAVEPGGDKAMVALVLYFDEYIMAKLPAILGTSWPLLQTRNYQSKTGGSDFFRAIDRLLRTEPQPAFVFEVYYFCLSAGFQGEYADDLAALDDYKQSVRSRVIALPPQRQPREPATSASPAPIKLPALYYGLALAVVVMMAFVLTVWSNQ